MSIVAKGQITITDLNDGVNGDNGKTYILNILNGVRSITYNASGTSPSPAQTAFSCELYEDGVLVKPTSYSWTASGVLSGTSSSATFTPTCATSFSNANNAVSLTVKYNNQTIRNTVPISATRVGANGTNGTNAILAVLSNETHTIPTDTSGNNGNYTGATTTMYIYNGATDDSTNWTVSATASNVTGSLSGKTYTVTAMSADIGYVDLTASRSGYTSITKRFTLTKSKQGTAGSNGSAGQHATAYKLISNVAAIGKNLSNVYIPATITISATSATGTAAPKAYAGRFVIAETTNGTSYTTKYTSSTNESSKIYTPSAGIKAINAKLYLAGGTSTLLDEQTIPIVSDGATGPQGVPGVQGPAGADGKTYYTWIKYADDASGNGMSDYPDGKKYIGMAYNKTTSVESTTASDYTWALIQGPQGATGANGKTYYTWLKYADTPTSGMSDSPDGKKYMGLAYNKTTATESTNYSDYTWSLIKGTDGTNGTDGKDGVGVKSTAITYQASTSGTTPPTGTWLASIPTVSAGQYLWTKTLITYTDNNTSTSYSVGKMGEQGKQGNAGKGISSTVTEYQASTSGTTPPTSTWSTSIPSVSAGQFLWTRITIKYTDGSTPSVSYSVSKMGDTGKGISQIKNYYLATSASSGVTTSTTGWTESVQTMTTTNKYLWNYERIVYTSGPDTVTTPTIIGTYGKDGSPGKGITSIVEYYLVSSSSSGITTSTSGWNTTIPTMTTTNKYLWNYEVINYTTGSPTTSTPKIIGVHGATGPQGPQGNTGPTGPQGAAGVGVQSTAVSYQASTSGTTPPTGSWSSGVPSVAAGQYLWTRTLITYTDGKSSTSYSVGKMGEQGKQGNTGRGISSTVTEYQVSTSGTTPPTGTWSTSVPSVAAGQYLWTRITISYTDGSTPSVSYAVGKMGAQGPQGNTGPQGTAGRSVVSITELYKKLNTKAQQATPTSDTGWSTTPPTWSSGYYLHMCTKITYDKGTPLVEYTKPFCDNSWEAVNEVNTQENIFNTLTNNGQTQGLYMQDKKLYLNGEYLKAGTVAADKLVIGMGENGGLCKNPAFKNWTSTYPDGTLAWSSGGISKQVVDGRNVAQFTCSTSGTQYGMSLSSSFFANNINLDGVEYIALEVKFRLTSGTNPSGSAFLVDIYATDGTYHRLHLNMSEIGSTLITNTWYTAKKVFQVASSSLAKTFKSCSGYLLANWSGSGNAIKTIQFATANAYIASKQDFLTQSWTNGTEINGAKIKTGTLSASQITTGTLDAAKVTVSNLNASNINSGTISADRLKASAISAINLSTESATINAAKIGNLDASKITSGTIAAARLDAGTIVSKINGGSTNISGNKIRTGQISANNGKSFINLDNDSMMLGSVSERNYLQWTGSSLNIQADNLKLGSESVATKSQLDQTARDFTFKFENYRKPNLISNGNPIGNNTDGWYVEGANAWLYTNNPYGPIGIASTNTSTEVFAFSPLIRIDRSGKYSVSFAIIKEMNVDTAEVFLLGGSSPDSIYEYIVNLTGFITDNNWRKVTKTVDIPANIKYLRFRIDHNKCNNTGGNYVVYFNEFMFIEGDGIYPPTWYPADNEVYNNITTINSEGITVLAPGANSRTNMSTNGFKITKNSTNEDVFSVNSSGNITLTGTVKSQYSDRWVGLDSGGVTFQDWNKHEQLLRMGISYFTANRDINGMSFAMPQYSDFTRFSHIQSSDLTNGWSGDTTQYTFMDFWSNDSNINTSQFKKGVTIYSPFYLKNNTYAQYDIYLGKSDYPATLGGNFVWSNKGISNLLGLYGDDGAALGYREGTNYMARIMTTEAYHPGTADNIMSWGHWNFNGYVMHNATFRGRFENTLSNVSERTYVLTSAIMGENSQIKVIYKDVQLINGQAILNIPRRYNDLYASYTVTSIVKKGPGDIWIELEESNRFTLKSDVLDIIVNVEITLEMSEAKVYSSNEVASPIMTLAEYEDPQVNALNIE